ncbi:MAG: outer membrane beta-barrel protein [Coraliomargaritaceae bacterium]
MNKNSIFSEFGCVCRFLLTSLFVTCVSFIVSGKALFGGSPLYTFNEWADLYFDGNATVSWDSNIFRDEYEEESDLTYILSPGLELNLGRGLSSYDMTVRTSYDFISYQENDQLDKNNFHINTSGVYRGSRLDLSGRLGYDENQITSGEDNMRRMMIEVEDVNGKINGEYRLNPKFSFGAGAHYFDRSYAADTRNELADRNHLRFPFDLFYEWTPKVDLSAGYTYKAGEIDDHQRGDTRFGGYDTTEHFFNVGARGNFFPKLSGFFKVGYRVQDREDSYNINKDGDRTRIDRGRGSGGLVGIDSGLTWNPTQKSTHNIVLERDFGVGGEGTTTEVSRIRIDSSYSLNPRWSASSNLGYTLRDYQARGGENRNREDNQYLLGLGLNYTAPDYWRFSGGYSYQNNDSSREGYSYDNHHFYLTAQLRY